MEANIPEIIIDKKVIDFIHRLGTNVCVKNNSYFILPKKFKQLKDGSLEVIHRTEPIEGLKITFKIDLDNN